MKIDHNARSLPEALNIDENFLTYYILFILAYVLEELPDMGSFSKEIDIYTDADESFWCTYPKLYEAMSRKEHSTLFHIGAKKASLFINKRIKDQESYDDARLSVDRNKDHAFNKYKENK